jgi:hypothetical protein
MIRLYGKMMSLAGLHEHEIRMVCFRFANLFIGVKGMFLGELKENDTPPSERAFEDLMSPAALRDAHEL